MLKTEVSSNEHLRYYQDAIQWLNKFGFDAIRADCEGYDPPAKLTNAASDSDQFFVPDITALRENSKSYFEISLKTESERQLVTKWKLLESMASLRNGDFKIFAPRGHVRFTREIVEKHSISAEIISI